MFRVVGDFCVDGSSGWVWLVGDDLDIKVMLGDVVLVGYMVESGYGWFVVWLDWCVGKVVCSLL